MASSSTHLFGPGSEALAALVGAVAMHAAMLESKIEFLTSSLGDIRQDQAAGAGFEGSARVIRATLADVYTSEGDAPFADQICRLLDEIAEVAVRRNLVVHDVWNVKQPGEWFVWKPKRSDKSTADWTSGETFHEADFRALIDWLANLHDETMRLMAEAAQRPRLPTADGQRALQSKSRVVTGPVE